METGTEDVAGEGVLNPEVAFAAIFCGMRKSSPI